MAALQYHQEHQLVETPVAPIQTRQRGITLVRRSPQQQMNQIESLETNAIEEPIHNTNNPENLSVYKESVPKSAIHKKQHQSIATAINTSRRNKHHRHSVRPPHEFDHSSRGRSGTHAAFIAQRKHTRSPENTIRSKIHSASARSSTLPPTYGSSMVDPTRHTADSDDVEMMSYGPGGFRPSVQFAHSNHPNPQNRTESGKTAHESKSTTTASKDHSKNTQHHYADTRDDGGRRESAHTRHSNDNTHAPERTLRLASASHTHNPPTSNTHRQSSLPRTNTQHKPYQTRHDRQRNPSTPLLSGFFFRHRRERLNWRLLAAIDVDQILRDVDIDALQEILENVTFCDIDAEDLRYIDPNFIKLFRLSQLVIEFLLHSQDRLMEKADSLKAELEDEQIRHEEDNKAKDQIFTEAANMKKELRTLRKTLYAYQLVAKLPGGIAQNTSSQAIYHRCSHCPKVFTSQYYLDAHLQRRHEDVIAARPSPATAPVPSPVSPVINAETQQPSKEMHRIADMIERFTIRLTETEQKLQTEATIKTEDRITREIMDRKIALEEIYKQERLRFEKELQDLKATMHLQMSEERTALQEERARFDEYMMRELKKKSHVGVLEDDDDTSKMVETVQKQQQAPSPQPTQPVAPKDVESDNKRQMDTEAIIAKVIEARDHEAEHTAAIAAEMEAKHEMALEAVQMRMAEDVERMCQSLIDHQNQERRFLEQRLNDATSEIHDMRNLLLQQKKDPPVQATPVAVVSPEADHIRKATPPPLSISIQSTNYDDQEHANPPQPQPTKAETKRDSDPSISKNYDKLWSLILKEMQKHTQTPNHNTPWIKSLYPHDIDTINDQKNSLSTLADRILAQNAITSTRIYNEWGISNHIASEFAQLHARMSKDRDQLDVTKPLLGRMRRHLASEVDTIVATHMDKAKAKPAPLTPILTDRNTSSPRRGRMQSVTINPAPASVEYYDNRRPITSPSRRNLPPAAPRSSSSPAVTSPYTPYADTMSPSSATVSDRHRQASIATSVTSEGSESEMELRKRMRINSVDELQSPQSISTPATSATSAKMGTWQPPRGLPIKEGAEKLISATKSVAKMLFALSTTRKKMANQGKPNSALPAQVAGSAKQHKPPKRPPPPPPHKHVKHMDIVMSKDYESGDESQHSLSSRSMNHTSDEYSGDDDEDGYDDEDESRGSFTDSEGSDNQATQPALIRVPIMKRGGRNAQDEPAGSITGRQIHPPVIQKQSSQSNWEKKQPGYEANATVPTIPIVKLVSDTTYAPHIETNPNGMTQRSSRPDYGFNSPSATLPTPIQIRVTSPSINNEKSFSMSDISDLSALSSAEHDISGTRPGKGHKHVSMSPEVDEDDSHDHRQHDRDEDNDDESSGSFELSALDDVDIGVDQHASGQAGRSAITIQPGFEKAGGNGQDAYGQQSKAGNYNNGGADGSDDSDLLDMLDEIDASSDAGTPRGSQVLANPAASGTAQAPKAQQAYAVEPVASSTAARTGGKSATHAMDNVDDFDD